MLIKDKRNNFLYFDVETASGEKSLAELREKNSRLADLWERRADYYRKSDASLTEESSDSIYDQKSPLEPEFNRVVCVSFGSFSDDGEKRLVSFCGEDEGEILKSSNKIFNNALAKGWKLCGHNIKAFDVPCLGKRMVYNGIAPSDNLNIWDKKPWEIPFIDTADVFSFGNWVMQKSLSLDLLACSLGIVSPKDDIHGSDVSKVFWNSLDYNRIKEYCEKDVKTVMEIIEKVS
jgi:predicted PolB exonuclease-like 3'-5' exonuclease